MESKHMIMESNRLMMERIASLKTSMEFTTSMLSRVCDKILVCGVEFSEDDFRIMQNELNRAIEKADDIYRLYYADRHVTYEELQDDVSDQDVGVIGRIIEASEKICEEFDSDYLGMTSSGEREEFVIKTIKEALGDAILY